LAPGATSKKYSLSNQIAVSSQNISNMIEIKPKLWLGNINAAGNKFQLQKMGINHIITIGK